MIFSNQDILYQLRLTVTGVDVPFVHVIIEVFDGLSLDRVKQATEELTAIFCAGREVIWRCKPEADEQKDFMTKETMRRGYSRFSFRLPDDMLPSKETGPAIAPPMSYLPLGGL